MYFILSVSCAWFSVLFRCCVSFVSIFFFFMQKTSYEMRISDWSSDVFSSDLRRRQLSSHRPSAVGGSRCPFRSAPACNHLLPSEILPCLNRRQRLHGGAASFLAAHAPQLASRRFGMPEKDAAIAIPDDITRGPPAAFVKTETRPRTHIAMPPPAGYTPR